MPSFKHSLCCESLAEERSAGNPHATFCGNRWRVTATDDPVPEGKFPWPTHLLVQIVPKYSVTELVTMIKSLTAREVIKMCPHVKRQSWGGEFWSDGYFASTVGKHGNEEMIANYVKNQASEYTKLHENHQLKLL